MKNINNFKLSYIRVLSNQMDERIGIGIVGDNNGKRQYFDGEKYCDIEPGYRFELAYHLTIQQAQELMNSLWEAGIQPVQAKGSVGQLAAVQHHLDDMRSIAFKFIDKKVVE